jgi:hypothetical protein
VSGAEAQAVQRFGDIVVVGGGCYGSYYVRQLRRARDAGAVRWERLVVVDRNSECRVHEAPEGITFIEREWGSFFAEYLGAAAEARAITDAPPTALPHAIVPSPLMPDWGRTKISGRGEEHLCPPPIFGFFPCLVQGFNARIRSALINVQPVFAAGYHC